MVLEVHLTANHSLGKRCYRYVHTRNIIKIALDVCQQLLSNSHFSKILFCSSRQYTGRRIRSAQVVSVNVIAASF